MNPPTSQNSPSRANFPRLRPHLSVVLPCYNEHEVIDHTYQRVRDVCNSIGRSYEIVMVNDGSRDETWHDMLRLSRGDPSLVAVNLSRNHGHQLAVSAGLQVASGERVMIMDADLQDPPELLPQMLAVMDGGADVVYAQRRTRFGDAPLKRAACAVFYRLLSRMSDRPIPLDTGDFRLLSRRVADLIVQMPERHRFIRGMVSWVGFRQEPLLYDRERRFAGQTKYPLRKLLRLAIDGVTSSSVKPLAFANFAATLAAAVTVVLVGYSLWSWIFVGHTPQGWTSLMIAITLLASAQLFMLGIIGEYLGRLYEQSRGRPLFMIDQTVRGGEADGPDDAHASMLQQRELKPQAIASREGQHTA